MSMTKRDEAFLRGLRKPGHWSEADARRALSLCDASGQSRAAFARDHGLRATRLAWWKKRLGEWTSVPPEQAPAARRDERFVELVAPAGEVAVTAVATVRVGHVVVELSTLDGSAAEFVASLSRALEAGVCS